MPIFMIYINLSCEREQYSTSKWRNVVGEILSYFTEKSIQHLQKYVQPVTYYFAIQIILVGTFQFIFCVVYLYFLIDVYNCNRLHHWPLCIFIKMLVIKGTIETIFVRCTYISERLFNRSPKHRWNDSNHSTKMTIVFTT